MLCFNRLRKECLRGIICKLNLHLGVLLENRLYRGLQRRSYIYLAISLNLIVLSTVIVVLREII